MSLRITLQSLTNQAIAETNRQTTAISRLQQQASTGNQLLAPSDDPARAALLATNDAQNQRLSAYLATIGTVRGTLDQGVSVLQDAGALLVGAKAIALQGSQSNADAATRETLAQQVDGLIQRLLGLANTQQNGQYLFAGSATQTQPFVVAASDVHGRATQITYQGSTDRPQAITGPGQTVLQYLNGANVFQKSDRGVAVYSGSTGAKPGTGTDSASGDVSLVVAHTATSYAASGILPGTSSAAGDTILGPAGTHHLVINDTSGTGSSGTVSLDGGPPIAFTNADTNLRIYGATGGVAFVDTTAIVPGFNGSVDITADGTLSTDGGATTTPIAFSANQQVVDSRTGAVVNVDTTAIKAASTEPIHEPGTTDAFAVLIGLRDALRNSALGPTAQGRAIGNRLDDLDRVHANILSAVGEQSTQLQALDGLQNHVQDLQLTVKKVASDLGDVNLSDVIVRLQQQNTLLQISYSGISKMFSTNLLDFLK